MGGPGWKRGLGVVLVGIVMGVGGLGSLPAAQASPAAGGGTEQSQPCNDCYQRPDQGSCSPERPCGGRSCSPERPCGGGARSQPCNDCYDRPAPCRECYEAPPSSRCDRRAACDRYDRDRPCRGGYRPGPCGYDDDYDYDDYGYGCAP